MLPTRRLLSACPLRYWILNTHRYLGLRIPNQIQRSSIDGTIRRSQHLQWNQFPSYHEAEKANWRVFSK